MADRRNSDSMELQLQADELHVHGHGLSKRISASVSSGEENDASWDKTQRNRNGSGGNGEPDTGPSVVTIEQAFRNKQVPPWWQQLTLRALVVSCILGILFSVIVMKLNLTTGVIPSLNVSAGLLGFFLVKSWTKLLEKSGLLKVPFTRQENTVIQTCVVACYGIAFSGGFGSYMLGMSSKIAEQIGTDVPGNSASDVKDPRLGWIIGFLFVVSFLGLLSIVPLRKIMVIDYKLTYPSGTATALLINGFHTPEGDKLARKQVKMLGKFFAGSFAWGFFQWFFTGGDDCGFVQFPTFGLKARDQKFYFDFSMTYVGAGMICPHLVNISILLGAIISWGILWPIIENQKGSWFPANLPQSSMRGLQGYKVFIAIAVILGDGLYNFVKIVSISLRNAYRQYQSHKARTGGPDIPLSNPTTTTATADDGTSYDEQRRNDVFMRDGIPMWAAAAGYVGLASISMGVIPQLFPTMRWYYVLVAYCMAPIMAFCNAYGCGLTDWSLASTYGKLAIFIFGAWAAHQPGHHGIVAALAGCGVLMSIVSTAADLMQDFKTGYLTLSSPRSMFLAQLLGTAMGCVIGPCTFWLFYQAFNVGDPDGQYPAPYALIYRNMALLGVEGFDSLPRHCLTICLITFLLAAVINLIRDLVPARVARYIPLPMAMAIPFYLGAYFAIDMCVGTLIVFVWQRIDRPKADILAPAVASGLLCGDGIWTLPSSILALAKLQPPICMKFLSRSANSKVDAFLGAS